MSDHRVGIQGLSPICEFLIHSMDTIHTFNNGDPWNHGISIHGIGLVISEYSGQRLRNVNETNDWLALIVIDEEELRK